METFKKNNKDTDRNRQVWGKAPYIVFQGNTTDLKLYRCLKVEVNVKVFQQSNISWTIKNINIYKTTLK